METLTERVRRQIADAIISGQLAPGTRLEEQALADRFQVSRTPTREALRQLAAAGLVEIRPRRGVIVPMISAAQISQQFEALIELEAACGRLAAQRMTAVERRQLERTQQACAAAAAADDRGRYVRHNHRFHSLIYTGAHNPTLASLVDNLRLRLQPFRNAAFRHQNRIPSSMAEHERIVAALIAAEPEATALALREHIVTSSLYVVEFFNNVRVDGSKVGMLRAGAA